MSLPRSAIRILREEGLKNFLRTGLAYVFSRLTLALLLAIAFSSIRNKLRASERGCRSLNDYFDVIHKFELPLTSPVFSLAPNQRRYEILHLLEIAQRPRFICEIGTASGGTSYLLCKAAPEDATIITIDIRMPFWLKKLLKSYAKPGQTLVAVKGDSHKQFTVRQVAQLLHGKEIDLLLIDGDHSYDGVKQDFLNFSPLVRKGGWIAFHDIVRDYRTRYGLCTRPNTGDVWRFWDETRAKYQHFEIVEDPRQDGYGIGVIVT